MLQMKQLLKNLNMEKIGYGDLQYLVIIINDILLFYVCYDGYIYICLLNKLNLLYKYKIQDYCRTRCINISPNGKYLIVGGNQPNDLKFIC